MDAKQVEGLIASAPDEIDFNWDELSYGESYNIPGLGSVQYVASKSPAEGGGEDIWVVFQVGDQLFKKYGYYMSYDEADWDGGLLEVKPVERQVTFYEKA